MATPTQLDDALFLDTVRELAVGYAGFPRESQVWAREGQRRCPYRALVLFGLSPRTRDALLVHQCQRIFRRCPTPDRFLKVWLRRPETWQAMVRQGQLPFLQSAGECLRRHGGRVPRDREGLLAIKGVGEKIVECVLGYGWGEEALPVDGHVCRVVGRVSGQGAENISPSEVRRQLKELYRRHRPTMVRQDLAMIDLHELFRLHGQLVCGRSPRCERCPLTRCSSRRAAYTGGANPPVSPDYWQDWRGLLVAG